MGGGSPLSQTVAAEALEGGMDGIQLRAKHTPARQAYEWGVALRVLTRRQGAWLGVHDRVDLALAVDADGVHLGVHSMPLQEVRRIAPTLRIGVSCHSVEEVDEAARGGADYVVLGPVFWTASKAEFGEPLGLQRLEEAASRVSVPVIAIGGITVVNAGEVLRRGASGVAVIGAVVDALDVRAAARALSAAVRQAHHASSAGSVDPAVRSGAVGDA